MDTQDGYATYKSTDVKHVDIQRAYLKRASVTRKECRYVKIYRLIKEDTGHAV